MIIAFTGVPLCVVHLLSLTFSGDFPGGSVVKNPPAVKEMWVQSPGREDPLKKEMATHSSLLAWRILWTGAGQATVHEITEESEMTTTKQQK